MIIHVDMDAFYASVEQRDNPALCDKPLIVGGSAQRRGVVAAANYQARKYGVHSAMSTAQALRRCPHAVLLPPRMEHYATVSQAIQVILEQFSPLVEPLSLDEAFLDVSGSEPLFGPAADIARQIKRCIFQELSLIASVGVAPTKFVAKIASDIQKPDGLVVVFQEDVQQFLDPLPVARLWGVGKVTERRFTQLAIRTLGQLRQYPQQTLRDLFGSSGAHFWNLANGIDPRPVVPDREARSLSHETTFPADVDDAEILAGTLVDLAEQVARRLRRHALQGRTLTIKVRYSDFSTVSRSHSLPKPTDVTQEMIRIGIGLLKSSRQHHDLPVRLLGFAVDNLSTTSDTAHSGGRCDKSGHAARQGLLFQDQDQDQDQDHERQRQLDRVTDAIAARFGRQAVHRGTKPLGE